MFKNVSNKMVAFGDLFTKALQLQGQKLKHKRMFGYEA